MIIDLYNSDKIEGLPEYIGFKIYSDYYTLYGVQFYDPVILYLLKNNKCHVMANLQAGGLFDIVDDRVQHEFVVKPPSIAYSSNSLGSTVAIEGQGFSTKVKETGLPCILPAFKLYFKEDYDASQSEPQIRYMEI